jgi:N-acetylmuramoyl-L-alanine amidase
MSSKLRALAVASCSAVLVAGVVTTAVSTSAAAASPVSRAATVGSVSLSRTLLTYPSSLVVTGTLTVAGSGHAVAGQSAHLQHRTLGSTVWHHAKGTSVEKTGRHGAVRWTVQPSANGAYRVYFEPSSSYRAVTTSAHGYRVQPLLKLDPTHTLPIFTDSTLTGTVSPHLSGVVYLQRFANGGWHRAAQATAVHGHYSFTVSPAAFGARDYRVYRKHDPLHKLAVTSALHVQIVNRDLSIGDTGKDVRALQKRLLKLHYDLGSASGSYGDDTLHAVTAFEKVQGLTRNGEVTTKVWKALNHPKRIHLRHPNAGTYEVEVNIGKQVVLLAHDGHIYKILDTSTAGGYLYTNSEGGTSRAITPTGHFTFQYKLTGTRVSKLGTLYYPSYFTNTGYAIHGEGNGNDGGEVPPYPNSHGCVRITDNAVLRYFSTPYLAVGTSVWIYH